MSKLKFKDIELGQHFWGLLDNELVMCFKNNTNTCFILTECECYYYENEITPIELVSFPEGYDEYNLYYY